VLLDEVGRGGMAAVYRAHDEVLDRTVAIKLLHAHLASDPAFLDRFRREARAAAALNHPNVVAVHDWGETPDGAYLVLQLVDGPSLREVLRARGRLSPRESLAVLGPAAAGLAAAHAAGLVHRDVKPENLLIGRDGSVRVTDFGLARAAASATATFGSDVLVGSPHYLSPEAVRVEPLDARSDVYALGIVLFECLTGRPPHEAESAFATAVAHTARPVPRPSELLPGLAPGLDDAVLRATERDRERRTPDADAFGRQLAAAVVGGPAQLAPLLAATTREPRRVNGAAHPAADTLTTAADAGPGTGVLEPDEDHPTTTVRRGAGGTHVVERDGDPGRGRQRRRGRGWVAVALLLALLGGSAAGGYLLWDRVLAPVTAIPTVLGLAADDATGELVGAGFEVTVAAERPHDLDVPEGHVLEQLPVGEARHGSTVELVLSAGPRQVEVPEVVGRSRDEAVAALEAAGLAPEVSETYDEEVPAGVVRSSSPGAGAVLDETSAVALSVSLGPQPIDVPSLVGRSSSEAAAVVADLGLEVEIVERRYDEEAPAGQVLSQAPGPDGDPLVRGDVIEVVVSDGPQPVAIPSVRGMQVEEAVAELEALGFVVEIERRGGFGAFLQPNRVFDQDPAPDATRPRGTTVLLYAYER
jgi:eukaryotic-like serine/threonine-protein kinase